MYQHESIMPNDLKISDKYIRLTFGVDDTTWWFAIKVEQDK